VWCAGALAILINVAAVCCQHKVRLHAGQALHTLLSTRGTPLQLISLVGIAQCSNSPVISWLPLCCIAPCAAAAACIIPGTNSVIFLQGFTTFTLTHNINDVRIQIDPERPQRTSAVPLQFAVGVCEIPFKEMFSVMRGSTTALSVMTTCAPILAASRPARPGPEPSSMTVIPV